MGTRGGDERSYKSLLEALAPFLRRNAGAQLARFGQHHYAEDVTQEILLAIHLKLHTYDSSMAFLPWVRAVMRHKIVDYLRKQKVAVASLDDMDLWEPADPENPELQAIRHDLQNLLGRLKPPAGDIIYALKVEGASTRDLAAQYKTSESNIKVIVHRGLQKLALLAGEGKTA